MRLTKIITLSFLLLITLNSCNNMRFNPQILSEPIPEIHPILFPKEYYDSINVNIYQKNVDKIPILMYHTIHDQVNWISTDEFRKHLKLLFEAGFTTIKLNDYLNNDFSSVPNGRKPIIITFDDQWASQFFYSDSTKNEISKDCAVGILEEFYKKQPIFGKNAVIYLFFHRLPFIGYDQRNRWVVKIRHLLDLGYELGSHSYDHSVMTNMDEAKIKTNLDKFYTKLESLIGVDYKKTMTLAYPGGAVPKKLNGVSSYQYKNTPLKGALKASGGFAKVPIENNDSIWYIPRIEGSSENILWLIKQETFHVEKVSRKIPKLFSYDISLRNKWLNLDPNQYHLFTFLNFSED